MKHSIILFLIIFSLTSILSANANLELTKKEQEFIKENPVIKVGVELDWPPFDFVENGEYKGFAKDYLDNISRQTGIKFQLILDTWPNLLKKTKNKQIDLLPILAKNEKREEFLLFTDKYLTIRSYLFSNALKYNSMEELKNKTIAIPKSYILEDVLRKEYPDINILTVDNLLDAMDAVVTNKADALISNIANINYLKNEHNIVDIYANFLFDKSNNLLYMATRDDYAVLRNIIDKALKNISYEQKQSIYDKWISNSKTVKNKQVINLTNEEQAYILKKEKVYISNEYEWLPYSFYEDNEAKGYVVDYIKLLSKKINLEPVFVTDLWSNHLKKIKNNEIDIISALAKNEKREEFLNFTDEILHQEITIITNISKSEIVKIDDLNNKKVGMIKNWNLTKIVKNNYPDLNVIEFDSISDILDAIKDNFIDATIQNKILAKYYINKSKYESHLKTIGSITLKDFNPALHLGMSKNDKTLLSIYNKAIKSVSNEELEELNQKWYPSSKKLLLTKEEKDFIESRTIDVAFTTNWRPFSFEKNGTPQGFAYDYLKLITKKTGLKTNISFENKFTDSLNSIKNKSKDLILLTSDTKERREYAIFSNTIFTTPIGIATLKDQNYIPDASYLEKKRVAVGKNYTAKKLLKERYPRIEFVETLNLQEALELLSENKVFAAVDSMPALSQNIKENEYTNIKISGTTKVDFNMKMMMREDYKLLQSIINKVLFNLNEEEKEEIKNRWINLEFEQKTDYSLIIKVVLGATLLLIFFIYKNRQLLNYQKELKKTKENLENSLENFRLLLDVNIAGILIVKEDKIKYLNNEILNILHLDSKEELLEKDITSLFPNIQIKKLQEENKNEAFEYTICTKNHSEMPILMEIKELTYDNEASNIISIIDLTDIKNKEELLLQQSKMASLGEMIGNIAHQWRQPLSTISTAASGMKLQKEFGTLNDEIFIDSVDTITHTSQFLSQTINDFQNYIKDDKEKRVFNINESLDKVLKILNTSFQTHHINIEKQTEDIEINSYPNELNQVLLNIFANSKDALKEQEEENKIIFIKTYTKNHNLFLEIIDNGGGMKKATLKKVFEPYFTTKHKSQGTGLGLYMTHKIITESMNGSIKIQNTKFKDFEKCTKVTISLPLE